MSAANNPTKPPTPSEGRDAAPAMSAHPAQTTGTESRAPVERSSRLNGVLGNDMIVRTVAAILMASSALLATVWGLWPFTIAIAVLSLIAAWEWGTVTRTVNDTYDQLMLGHAGAVSLAALATAAGYGLPALLALTVLAAILTLSLRNKFGGLGILATGIPAMALLFLRRDEGSGLTAVMFVFMVVWVTDTAALVWGRTIGGVRLWPSISPNKTWAGALGGAVTALVAGIVFAWALQIPSAGRLALIALLLSIAAQCGDLAMSALKRRFGRKDTSRLIPGHGGVLDRVDGLLLSAAAAGVLAVILDARHPGAALLGL
jgi:phosphatidate cytidylyltransferase